MKESGSVSVLGILESNACPTFTKKSLNELLIILYYFPVYIELKVLSIDAFFFVDYRLHKVPALFHVVLILQYFFLIVVSFFISLFYQKKKNSIIIFYIQI